MNPPASSTTCYFSCQFHQVAWACIKVVGELGTAVLAGCCASRAWGVWRQSESGTWGFSLRVRQMAITQDLLVFGDIDVQGVVLLAEHAGIRCCPVRGPPAGRVPGWSNLSWFWPSIITHLLLQSPTLWILLFHPSGSVSQQKVNNHSAILRLGYRKAHSCR